MFQTLLVSLSVMAQAAAAASGGVHAAPHPAVVVCIRALDADPCTAGALPVEGEIRAFGVSGPATVRWWVDGTAIQEVSAEIDGVSRHLLLLGQDNRDHRVELEASVGEVYGFGTWVGGTGSEPCPFDLQVVDLIVEPGRWISAVIGNEGPAASGWTKVRWLVDGMVRVETSVASVPPGSTVELVMPLADFEDLLSTVRVALLVEVTAGDLEPSNNFYEAVVPVHGPGS